MAARRALGDRSLTADFRGETINYLDSAERYISQLDPLKAGDRTGEFEETNSGYHYQNDLDRMKKAFGRLLGSDWPNAWKISEDSPKPKAGCSYGEKSVFEVGSVSKRDNDD